MRVLDLPLSSLQQVLLLLAIIILASKGTGALSKRFGQPAVLGELAAGLILGPTVLNLMHWPIFTESNILEPLIKFMAELGVIFLMFLAGLETDLKEMKRVGLAAVSGATGGVILPFFAGALIAHYLGGYAWFPSIFIGTILTATSVSISAQTLLELGQLRSKEGTTILGAAVVDDVAGIIILSIVIAAHGANNGGVTAPIWWVITQMVFYFVAAVGLGRYLVPRMLRWADRWPGFETGLAMTIVLGLLYAMSAEAVGKVAAITGSYTLGVMIAQQHDLGRHVAEKLHILAYSFFVPIFFVSIGLETDAAGALRGNPWLAASLLVGAILAKIIGSGIGVRAVGFDIGESIRVGIGMISRGEVALIVANNGLAGGVITKEMFSIMVLMALVTTLVTPFLLRLVFKTPSIANVSLRVNEDSSAYALELSEGQAP